MQFATLGNTGLIVSRLAFGAMTFTSGNRAIRTVFKTEAQTANQLVGRALDAGINFFDTADGYAGGQSEEMLGAALSSHRDEVVIATKVGFRSGQPLIRAGLTRRHILWSIDQSLKRLQTDWIDLYIVHKEDEYTPLEETLSALNDVVRSGKARYIGFSNWSAWKAAAAIEIQRAQGLAAFTHGQMYYSLLGRDIERDVIPMMRRYGIGLTVGAPRRRGFCRANTRAIICRTPTIASPVLICCLSTRSRVSAWSRKSVRLAIGAKPASRRFPWPGCCRGSASPR